mgnify:CR=1 FL=1
MSKLVDGIKDRMVAAAREAAPAVVDAAQKARPRLPRKLPRQLPMPRTRQGRRPSPASPLPLPSP